MMASLKSDSSGSDQDDRASEAVVLSKMNWLNQEIDMLQSIFLVLPLINTLGRPGGDQTAHPQCPR